MLVMVIDRHWTMAAVWALIGAAFAGVGIIHVPEAGFENFTTPVWEQCSTWTDCWDYAEQYMFFVAYLMLAGTFALIHFARMHADDETLLARVEDKETEECFKDWFADAALDTSHSPWRQLEKMEHDLAEGKPEPAAAAPDSEESELKADNMDDLEEEIDA